MTEPVIPPMPDEMEQALASPPSPVKEDAYKAWAQISEAVGNTQTAASIRGGHKYEVR